MGAFLLPEAYQGALIRLHFLAEHPFACPASQRPITQNAAPAHSGIISPSHPVAESPSQPAACCFPAVWKAAPAMAGKQGKPGGQKAGRTCHPVIEPPSLLPASLLFSGCLESASSMAGMGGNQTARVCWYSLSAANPLARWLE
jgi:hypothetical protein